MRTLNKQALNQMSLASPLQNKGCHQTLLQLTEHYFNSTNWRILLQICLLNIKYLSASLKK